MTLTSLSSVHSPVLSSSVVATSRRSVLALLAAAPAAPALAQFRVEISGVGLRQLVFQHRPGKRHRPQRQRLGGVVICQPSLSLFRKRGLQQPVVHLPCFTELSVGLSQRVACTTFLLHSPVHLLQHNCSEMVLFMWHQTHAKLGDISSQVHRERSPHAPRRHRRLHNIKCLACWIFWAAPPAAADVAGRSGRLDLPIQPNWHPRHTSHPKVVSSLRDIC